MTAPINEYPRESDDHQPITVTVDGVTHTTGVLVAVVRRDDRPTTWSEPVTLGGRIGVMTGAYDVGGWHIWAKVTDAAPETPVIHCGYFNIT